MLEQIVAEFPAGREKALRVFTAVLHDDQRFLNAAIECAFETWMPRAPQ